MAQTQSDVERAIENCEAHIGRVNSHVKDIAKMLNEERQWEGGITLNTLSEAIQVLTAEYRIPTEAHTALQIWQAVKAGLKEVEKVVTLHRQIILPDESREQVTSIFEKHGFYATCDSMGEWRVTLCPLPTFTYVKVFDNYESQHRDNILFHVKTSERELLTNGARRAYCDQLVKSVAAVNEVNEYLIAQYRKSKEVE